MYRATVKKKTPSRVTDWSNNIDIRMLNYFSFLRRDVTSGALSSLLQSMLDLVRSFLPSLPRSFSLSLSLVLLELFGREKSQGRTLANFSWQPPVGMRYRAVPLGVPCRSAPLVVLGPDCLFFTHAESTIKVYMASPSPSDSTKRRRESRRNGGEGRARERERVSLLYRARL